MMHVRTLGSGLGLGLGLVGMDTVDPCHGQLAAALERAASRVLRYGDESEEGEGWCEPMHVPPLQQGRPTSGDHALSSALRPDLAPLPGR